MSIPARRPARVRAIPAPGTPIAGRESDGVEDVEGAMEAFAWSAVAGMEGVEAGPEAVESDAPADNWSVPGVLLDSVGADESLGEGEGASLPVGGAELWAGGGVKSAVWPKAGSG